MREAACRITTRVTLDRDAMAHVDRFARRERAPRSDRESAPDPALGTLCAFARGAL
jgi:hypothetical protein